MLLSSASATRLRLPRLSSVLFLCCRLSSVVFTVRLCPLLCSQFVVLCCVHGLLSSVVFTVCCPLLCSPFFAICCVHCSLFCVVFTVSCPLLCSRFLVHCCVHGFLSSFVLRPVLILSSTCSNHLKQFIIIIIVL